MNTLFNRIDVSMIGGSALIEMFRCGIHHPGHENVIKYWKLHSISILKMIIKCYISIVTPWNLWLNVLTLQTATSNKCTQNDRCIFWHIISEVCKGSREPLTASASFSRRTGASHGLRVVLFVCSSYTASCMQFVLDGHSTIKKSTVVKM